ncbi:hypothetical protein [Celerinatantimonas sp. YJH-8]|uniref:hypothetical protein n=1 Tax=Celerinatantimonas sp. YJH-8 TaxID=3228714 RepID=UPI0038C35496
MAVIYRHPRVSQIIPCRLSRITLRCIRATDAGMACYRDNNPGLRIAGAGEEAVFIGLHHHWNFTKLSVARMQQRAIRG